MKSYELIKHSAAIHISNSLTCAQRMISNVLLKNAYSNLMKKEVHKIKVTDLIESVDYNSNDFKALKEALYVLNKTQIQWNILNKDKKNNWGVTSILAFASIEKGICSYSYSLPMQEMLSNPNIYARLNLLIQTKFKSKYALVIWEYLVEFLCSNKFKSGYTEWLSLEAFKKLLGVQKSSYYELFKNTNRRLIKDSLKEINSVSDITAEPEYRKESRKVIAIRFKVFRKSDFQLPTDLSIPLSITDNDNSFDKQLEKQLETEIIEKNTPILDRLLSFGLTEKQAEKHMQDHNTSYIKEILDIVQKDCEAGKVKSVPAYTNTALREDYRPKKTFIDKVDIETEKLKKLKAMQEKQEKEELFKTLFLDYESKRLDNALDKLNKKKTADLKKEFEEHVKKENNPILLQCLKKDDFKSIVVKGNFWAFSKEKLLKNRPTKTGLSRFIKSKGHSPIDFKNELDGF